MPRSKAAIASNRAFDEFRRVEHVHHQVRHAAKRPCALEQREGDAHVAESGVVGRDECRQRPVTDRIVRIGKRQAVQRTPLQPVLLNDPDVLVHRTVPHHSKLVPPMTGPNLFERRGSARPILGKVIAQNVIQIGCPVITFQFLLGRNRVAELPGHPIGLLVPDGVEHALARGRGH